MSAGVDFLVRGWNLTCFEVCFLSDGITEFNTNLFEIWSFSCLDSFSTISLRSSASLLISATVMGVGDDFFGGVSL